MLSPLETEAARQLGICNACRYCEGYCAVFPLLERRRELDSGDLVQLANLCHDCRDCYYACMYAPPHEFGVNIPLALTKLRSEAYDTLPGRAGQALHLASGRRGAGFVFGLIGAVIVIVSLASRGAGALVARHHGSPYQVVPYLGIVSIGAAILLVAIGIAALGAHRYWRAVGSRTRDLFHIGAIFGTAVDAIQLRYMAGGGARCDYPTERPSAERRILHQVVAGGFLCCLAATIAAAVSQDLLGSEPPYRLVSVPVLLGTIGGVALVIGTIGLARLKRAADPAPSDPAMALRDFGLLGALFFLGLTGLAALVLRSTAAYPIVLVVHLSAVFVCFFIAPATKFVHPLYRLLALLRDRLEVAHPAAIREMIAVVLADTHRRADLAGKLSGKLRQAIEGADVVLHTGDFTTREVLEELRAMAVVHGVLGNNDGELAGLLPDSLLLDLEGVSVAMLHDSGRREGRAERLHRRFPGADVVVFGHSHVPLDEAGVGGQRLFNPGSPTERRAEPFATFGLLEIDAGVLRRHALEAV